MVAKIWYDWTMLRMDQNALERFLDDTFPQARTAGFEIATLDEQHIALRLVVKARHLRPGNTVSGPTLMTLADSATYLLILAHLGPVGLAVTTNLNIHFMRKPACEVLMATATLLKLGKRIAVAEVRMHSADDPTPYAHATVSYSIPPER